MLTSLRGLLIPLLVSPILAMACNRLHAASFPRKPIRIVVYTGPSGMINTTARRFADLAAKIYTDETFLVENKPEGGGIAAIQRVLQLPADGHTLYASTRSNIAKLVVTNRTEYIDSLHWLAMLMADPECVITHGDSEISTFAELLEDARTSTEPQLWLGPAAGGLDHIMAMKVWDQFDINATWIPYSSGGAAKTDLLGRKGIAYVGNPSDTQGMPDLRVAVVSSQERLKSHPNAPTFGEFGATELDGEVMWRGFAVKKGTPEVALRWYEDLFQRVTADPEWKKYWEKDGTRVSFVGSEEFTEIVLQDEEELTEYLTRLDLAVEPSDEPTLDPMQVLLWAIGLTLAFNVALFGWSRHRRRSRDEPTQTGHLLISATLLCVCIFLVVVSTSLPVTSGVGPAIIPQLWSGLLIVLCIAGIFQGLQAGESRKGGRLQVKLVSTQIAALVAYLVGLIFVGYFISTAIYLASNIRMLGCRDKRTIGLVVGGWLLLVYVGFVRSLQVSLPAGRWIEPWL